MATVQRSLFIVFLERYALTALQLAAYVLLARLLSPNEVGIYATLAAMLAIVQVVRDFGVGTYVIQHRQLDDDVTRQALGITYVIALALFLGVNAAAGSLARFYETPDIEPILRVMSLNLLIYPFNSISTALLRRELRFGAIAKANVSAAVVGTAVTLLLAWRGHGPVSLALGELASSLITMTVLISARGWLRPALPGRARCREILDIGGSTTLAGIVTSVSMNINDIVTGKLLDFTQVGIASRAMGLMNLFHRDVMGSIRSVTFPVFARTWRDGQDLETQYLRTLTLTTAVAWPFYGAVAIFPLEVLRLMFGPQWDAAAQLVPVYCLAGAVSVLSSYVPSLMQACGQARLAAIADLIIQPLRALLLIGLLWHWRALLPLAIGYLVMAAVAVPYFYAFKQRCLPTDFKQLLREITRNLLLALLCLLPAGLVAVWLRPPGAALTLPLWMGCCMLIVLTWLIALKLLRHPMHGEIKTFIARRKAAATAS
jgi:O-antigen/teichoic acid export membrane protein